MWQVRQWYFALILLLAWRAEANAAAPPAVCAAGNWGRQGEVRKWDGGQRLPPRARLRLGSSRLRHIPSLNALTFSSDGRYLITSGSSVYHPRMPEAQQWGTAIWDAASGCLVRRFGRSDSGVRIHALSRDGKTLAVGDDGHTIDLWDLASGKFLRRIQLPEDHCNGSLVFSLDAQVLICIGGEVTCWDVATGRFLRRIQLPGDYQGGVLGFSPDGKRIAAMDLVHHAVQLWDWTSGKECYTFTPGKGLTRLLFFPDGSRFILAGAGVVQVRDTASANLIRQWNAGLKDYLASAVALSPDGQVLATEEADGWVQLWDVTSGRAVRRPLPHAALSRFRSGAGARIAALAFSPDGGTLAIGTMDGFINLWDVRSGAERVPRPGHESAVFTVAFSPDGRHVLSGGFDGTARLWAVEKGRQMRVFPCEDSVSTVLFSGDGTRAAVGTRAGIVHWLDPARETPLLRWKAHRRDVSGLSVLAEDAAVISANWEGIVCTYDLKKKAITDRQTYGPRQKAVDVALPARNPTVIAWAAGSRPSFVGFPDWRPLGTADAEVGGNARMTFSPDQRFLAFGDSAERLQLCDVTSREVVPLGEELDPEGEILDREPLHAIAFSPDGRLVASVEGYAICVWEVLSQQKVLYIRTDDHLAMCLAFSPDSSTLVSGGQDGTLLVWDCMPQRHAVIQALKTDPERELPKAWVELTSADARRAYAATRALAALPETSVPFLTSRIRPFNCKPSLARLVEDLDAEESATRDRATRTLQGFGAQAGPALRHALSQQPSVEMKYRTTKLLGRLDALSTDQTIIHQDRALAVLEYSRSPLARKAVEELASGDRDAWVTQAAVRALKRMKLQSQR